MKSYGKTDIGQKRKSNQDNFSILSRSDYLLAVVCDGMGGAQGGNIASSTAIRTFCTAVRQALAAPSAEQLQDQDVEVLLRQAVSDANTEVYRKAAEDSDLEGMGTTLVGALCCRAGCFAVNVGDSRLYVRNADGLQQITKDHSFIQYLLEKGLVTSEEATHHPNRNIILRALGVNEEVEADIYRIASFDKLLLCSDGLYNMLSLTDMQDVVDGTYGSKTWPPGYRARVNELIRRANRKGGQDNITAVLIGNE